MSDVLTDEMLSKVARLLSWNDVCPLAREYLSFKNAELENISLAHPDREAANLAVLVKWRNNTRGTEKSLCEVLDKARQDGISIDPAVGQLLAGQEANSSSNAFEDFQQKIKAVYNRDFAEISINPGDPSQRIPVEEIHVDIDLQFVDDVQLTKTKIPSYEEAFSGGDHTDRIVLFAAPGAGKTVQCKMIAFKSAKYGTLMEKYKLVIFLQLSGVSHSEEVSQVIIDQLMPDMRDQHEQINRILKEHKKDILFVADSYDEMSPDMETTKKTKGQFTIADLFKDKEAHLLVSTRPTRLDDLKKDVFLKKKLNIIGLSEENARKLAKLYCDKRRIPAKSPVQSIEDFIMQELRQKNLMDLSKNPATLTMVCNWMRENNAISNSLTALYEYFFKDLKESFLRTDHADADKQKIKNVLMDDEDEEIMKALEHFAFVCVMKSQIISSETDYVKILQEDFVRVCDALGMIYFQEPLGCGQRIIGFRHKSQGEFLAAKYLARQLRAGVNLDNEDLRKFVSECGDINKILHFERVLVFLSGLCETEEAAQLLMHTVTDVFTQVPEVHSKTELKSNDTDDYVRQLVLLQIKCKDEMKCNTNRHSFCSEFLNSVEVSVPHLEHFPNEKYFVDGEENLDRASISPAGPASISANLITRKDIVNLTKRKIDHAANHSSASKLKKCKLSNGDLCQAFCFRVAKEETRLAIRIDKFAVQSDNNFLDILPAVSLNSPCYFVSALNTGIKHLSLIAYSLKKEISRYYIRAVDFSSTDINLLHNSKLPDLRLVALNIISTVAGYTVSDHSNVVVIDTHLDETLTAAAVRDLEHFLNLPCHKLFLKRWKFGQGDTASQTRTKMENCLRLRKKTGSKVVFLKGCDVDCDWLKKMKLADVITIGSMIAQGNKKLADNIKELQSMLSASQSTLNALTRLQWMMYY